MGFFKKLRERFWPDLPEGEDQRSTKTMNKELPPTEEEVSDREELEDFKHHLEAVMGSKYRSLISNQVSQFENTSHQDCCGGGCGTSYSTPSIEEKSSHGEYSEGKGWGVGYDRVNE